MVFMDCISSNSVCMLTLNLPLSITPARKSNYTFQRRCKKEPYSKKSEDTLSPSGIKRPSTNVNLWDRNMGINNVTSRKDERLLNGPANTIRT
jgi:hypothetical protein